MPSNLKLGTGLREFLKTANGIVDNRNRVKLNLALDELSGTHFKKVSAESCQDLMLVLADSMQIVDPTDATLAAKICHILSSAAQPHSTKIFASNPQMASVMEDWCLRAFQFGSEMSLLQALSSLEMILRGRAITADPTTLSALLNEKQSGSLTNWLKRDYQDRLKVLPAEEVIVAALRVVKAISSPTEIGVLVNANAHSSSRIRRLEACTVIFKNQLANCSISANLQQLKAISTCLRGLQAVLLQRPVALDFPTGFGFVRAFWLVGLPEYDSSSFPPVPAEPGPPPPTAGLVPKLGSRRGPNGPNRSANAKQVRRLRSALVKETEDDSGTAFGRREVDETGFWSQTSDSEDTSDCNLAGGRGSRDIAAANASVRFAAIRLLLLLIKNNEPQVLMAFWDQLVPYSPPGGPPPTKPSLPCCLLRDANTGSKIASAQCFGDLLNRCRMYLIMAEASSAQLAFTPWSHSLAQSLESCQRYLTLSLSSNRIVQCLAAILTALSSLVVATPYHRLPSGLLTRLSRCVRPYLINKNVDVKSAALSVFTGLLSSTAATQKLPELQTILQKPEPSSFFGSVENSSTNMTSEDERQEVSGLDSSEDFEDLVEYDNADLGKTWLVEFCLSYLQKSDAGLKLKLEVCRTLAVIATSNFELLLADNGNTLVTTANLYVQAIGTEENDTKLQMAAGRGIVDLGEGFSTYMEDPDNNHNLKHGLAMWSSIIENSVPRLSTNANPSFRSLLCDILSSMGPQIYENIERSSRLLIAFTLFALCRDQCTSVKIQAVRALGMCAGWPIEMEDGQFLLDATEYVSSAISNEEDRNLINKVTWALGNISDELLSKKDKGFPDTVPSHLVVKLIQDSIKFCNDDMLKMNAVRSLGNLIRLLPPEQLRKPAVRELVFQSVNAIVACATDPKTNVMKFKWNALYSLASLLRGTDLHDEVQNWQSMIFPVLCDMVVNSPNFKVRISAAIALAAPRARANYLGFYLTSWNALLEALASADNIQDFKEFQHRDNLVDQICLSICHVVCCLTAEDLSGGLNGSLIQMVMGFEENLVTQLQRVRLRIVPEKAQPFSNALEHVKKLAATTSGGVRDVCEQLVCILSSGQAFLNEVC